MAFPHSAAGGDVMGGLLAAALVTVVIHNPAGASDAVVVRAKAGIERIFRDAGIQVLWADTVGVDHAGLQVTIRRAPDGGPGAGSPSALGTTVREDYVPGGSAFIFYDRVLAFAHAHRQSIETILAYAVAHELGHVLLPPPAHTTTGLMKAEWGDDELRHFAA